MSVWRIKDVDDKTRSQAEAAAQQAGVPLGAWLERAVMRRIDVAKKPAPAASAAVAAEPGDRPTDAVIAAPLTADPSERIAPATGKRRTRKTQGKKRGKAAAASAAAGEAAIAPPAEPTMETSAATADTGMTSSAPVMVAKAEAAEVPTAAADPIVVATDAAVEPDSAAALPPVEEAPEPAVFTAQEEQPDTAVVEPDTTAVEPDIAPIVPTSPPRRGFSLLPVFTIVGLIAIVAVGGYFLFVHDDNDAPVVAQNPPPVAKTDVGKPPAATPAPATPPATSTPSPAPAPASGSDVANAPKTPALPPGIPAPTPGVQPSLLIPVPGSDAPPVVLAPPAADFPNRPGPVVAQQASIPALIERAQAGDVDAQIELGKRYMQGAPADQKPAEALRWLEKAAEAGNGQAQFNVAVMYERGIGTTVDPLKAEAWYRKAAGQPVPVPTAIHNLALLYAAGGAGIKADPVQARALMTQSAELGLPESQFSLALMYYQGVGGAADNVAALSWLALAARTNNPQMIQAAQQLVAVMSEADKAKAQQLANQHVKRINDNLTRLRAIANGGTPPAVTPPADKPLDRAAILEIQKLLAALKLLTDPADGAIGPKTEQAIRDYQAMAGLPVDGKATMELLTSLRDVAGAVTPK